MVSGEISESPQHKIKLHYGDGDSAVTVLWEPKAGSRLLQTFFNGDGAIVDQHLLNIGGHEIKEAVEAYLSENGIEPKESVYEDIAFARACPSCNSYGLQRYAELVSDASKIPVMPIYVCRSCGKKSYYLTDEYLSRLAKTKKELFEADELSEMEKDEQKFINEIKAYIVRIYASKHIPSIR